MHRLAKLCVAEEGKFVSSITQTHKRVSTGGVDNSEESTAVSTYIASH